MRQQRRRPTAVYPGDIIPEQRAKSSRNTERHQIGLVGDIIPDSRATSLGISTGRPQMGRSSGSACDNSGQELIRVLASAARGDQPRSGPGGRAPAGERAAWPWPPRAGITRGLRACDCPPGRRRAGVGGKTIAARRSGRISSHGNPLPSRRHSCFRRCSLRPSHKLKVHCR